MILPMDIADMIPVDDAVRLLNAAMERMNYSKLNADYSHNGRIQISPKRLFKILVYAYMNGFYSSRKIEKSLFEEVISLLDGKMWSKNIKVALQEKMLEYQFIRNNM